MRPSHLHIGRLGEEAVANHLIRKGFTLREKNYRRKWGEIDLVLEKQGTIHFVEVKTVSASVGTAPSMSDVWLPEENVHPFKLRKLSRAIETWLLEHRYEGEWQLDVAAVYLDVAARRAQVRFMENVGW